MSYTEFEEIIGKLRFLSKVGLTGMGESTLHPDFFKMVGLTRRLGMMAAVVTNCNRHTQEVAAQLISSGLARIGVSIDGAKASSYERTRKGAHFGRTMSNLRRLTRLRGSAKTPRIEVQMVALRYNFAEIPDLVRLCSGIGVDSLMVQGRPTDWGKQEYVERTIDAAATRVGGAYDSVMAEAKAVAEELKFELIDHRSLYDDAHKCPKPWRDVYVSTTGDVVPCCTIADPRVVCMGNLFRESFAEIWNGPKYVSFRKVISAGRIPRCCWQCYAPDRLLEASVDGSVVDGAEMRESE